MSDITKRFQSIRTTVYVVKKCRNDDEGVHRRAGSGPKGVVDQNRLWDAI